MAKPVRGATRLQAAQPKAVDQSTPAYARYQERGRLAQYLAHHKASITDALLRLVHTPLASLITIICVALSLFLPALAFLLTQGIDRALESVNIEPTVSAYYLQESGRKSVNSYEGHVKSRAVGVAALAGVRGTRIVSPQQALRALQASQGEGSDTADSLQNLVAALGQNPLPWRLDVELTPGISDASLRAVQSYLLDDRKLFKLQYDQLWRDRLQAVREGLSRIATLLAGLFSLGIIAMFSAALRALILDRHKEVRLLRLIGATKARIRRPFLYAGALLGALSAIFVLIALSAIDVFAIKHFEQLLATYTLAGKTLSLAFLPLGFRFSLVITVLSISAGILAAWIVCEPFLREPEE